MIRPADYLAAAMLVFVCFMAVVIFPVMWG